MKSRLKKTPRSPERTPHMTQSEVNATPADKKFFKRDVINESYKYDFCWIKGKRPTMEDEHLACELDENTTMFGIFDGHGTNAVSRQLVNLFPKIFKRKL